MSEKALNPHAPQLDVTARLLGRFHVTGVFWYWFPYWSVSRFPPWLQSITEFIFTVFFFVTLGRIRSAISSNLEPVLGPASRLTRWRRAFRTMHDFASGMTDRYAFFRKPQKFAATVEGLEHWQAAMASGSGVILASAHIGFWEIAPQFGASAEKRRIHIVREKEINPQAQQFVERLLARTGEELVTHFASDDPALGVQLAEALRSGEIVAFQADRPRAGGRAVVATMFGRPMPLPIGPAVLARAIDVPLVPVFNFRAGRYRTHIVVRPPIRVPHTADRDADVASTVAKLASEIESAIRREPHQWFCFRRLW